MLFLAAGFLLILLLVWMTTRRASDQVLATSPAPNPDVVEVLETFNHPHPSIQPRIVFLGDSITAKWAEEGRETWEHAWLPRKAVNFGVSGDRTEHVLWRLQQGLYDGISPALTILQIGTNNSAHQNRRAPEHGGVRYTSPPEETAQGIAAIVKLLREKEPEMKILLLAIFPRDRGGNDPHREQNDQTNRLIAKLDDGVFIHYLDLTREFCAADGSILDEFMPDGLHLSGSGYHKWSAAIENKVNELLDQPVIPNDQKN